MQFGSRHVREAMSRSGDATLLSLRQSTKRRYQQTLMFMQEWTNDLMERENELQQQRQEFNTSLIKPESKTQAQPQHTIDVQRLIKQQFLKRVESLYVKQLALDDLSQAQQNQSRVSNRSDSLNHTHQSNTFDEIQPESYCDSMDGDNENEA